MPIAHAVLGVLARGPRHGYELRRALEEELGADWRVDYGQLYRVLARLERAGWVRLHREERATGPTRKVRAITAAGRRELARWSAAPAAPIRQRDATPVQRRFGERLAPLTVGASDDPVLALLGATLGNRHPELGFRTEPLGSLAGLWALRDGRVQLAGVHLLDVDTGLYNVPFVKHLLLEESIVLLTLVRREQGLMLAKGNPLRVRGVRDLVRRGVRLVNRQRGTGTRLLLQHLLRAARVDPRAVNGWDRVLDTHGGVAAAVAAGTADAAPGVRAAAVRAGLDFLSLGVERYDLAIPLPLFDSPRLRPLREALHARAFRRSAAALPGYDVGEMGTVAAVVKS